jgi:HSP90 family molecular chaperone
MILEINPSHPVIKKLLNLVKEDSENTQAAETANLLSDTALVVSGRSLLFLCLF